MGKRLTAVLSLIKRKSSINEPAADAPPDHGTKVAVEGEAPVVDAVEEKAAEVVETIVEAAKTEPSSSNATIAEASEVKPSEESMEVLKDATSDVLEATTAAASTLETLAVTEREPVTEVEAPTTSPDIIFVESAPPTANVEAVEAKVVAEAPETVAPVGVAEATPSPEDKGTDKMSCCDGCDADAAVKIETLVKAAAAEPQLTETAAEGTKSESDVKAEVVTTAEKVTKEIAPEKLHKRSKSITFFNMFVKQETAKSDPVFEASKDDADLAPIEAPKHRRRSSVSFLGCFSKPKAMEA